MLRLSCQQPTPCKFSLTPRWRPTKSAALSATPAVGYLRSRDLYAAGPSPHANKSAMGMPKCVGTAVLGSRRPSRVPEQPCIEPLAGELALGPRGQARARVELDLQHGDAGLEVMHFTQLHADFQRGPGGAETNRRRNVLPHQADQCFDRL